MNMKTITKNIGFAQITFAFAFLFVAAMVIPSHAFAWDEEGYGFYDQGASTSYYSGPAFDAGADDGYGRDYSKDSSKDGKDIVPESRYYSVTPSYSYDTYSVTPSYGYDTYSVTPSYGYDTYSNTPSYVPSSGCSSCGGSSYSYVPATSRYIAGCTSSCGSSYSTPRYVPNTTPSCGSSCGGSSYTTPSYVYSSNTAANNNANTSNSSSSANSSSSVGNITNNNVNNNTVVVNVPSGTSNTNTPPATPGLEGYCTINPNSVGINQDVYFSASATGGNGNYTYSWSGSDGISSSGQSFTGHFSSYGSKTATVTIQSGNQSISRTCSVNVQNNNNNSLSAYCVASPTNAGVNQSVTWTVYPSGYANNSYNNNYNNNVGNYTYSWSGTDGLSGYNQSVYMNYNNPGYKTASVTVFSNGQSVVATCNTTVGGAVSNVTVIREPSNGTPVSGVYLSQIPATGIDLSMKTVFFLVGLTIWSAFVAFMLIARRKNKNVLATAGVQSTQIASGMTKAEIFKMTNKSKLGM